MRTENPGLQALGTEPEFREEVAPSAGWGRLARLQNDDHLRAVGRPILYRWWTGGASIRRLLGDFQEGWHGAGS